MQPLMPHERQALKDRGVTDAEIDEYQQLLAERSSGGPNFDSGKFARLRDLAQKIMSR
jgi:hypothetical protein